METAKKLSVSQLNGYIKSVFDDELILHNISVYGELSQLSVREKATYFTITEGGCYIDCVMFSAMENIEVGTLVQVYGSVTFYPKSGKTNFTARSLTKIGKGELQDEFKKLVAKLKSEGLFDNRPKPPIYISRVALITSEAGAVVHDIMSVIRDKGINIDLRLFPASVQGSGAESAIIEALDRANDGGYDVIVIARGGGSNYDLDVFNGEKLARAVAGSDVPVISAVGHETDYTLCDFCAGARAGTPSIAAAVIADTNLDFLARFHEALRKINTGISRIYDRYSGRAYRGAASVIHSMDKKAAVANERVGSLVRKMSNAISDLYANNKKHISSAASLLDASMENVLNGCENWLSSAAYVLEYASPLKALARGYAKVVCDGSDVNDVASLKVGSQVQIFFTDGKADAKIISTERINRKNES